MAYRILGQLPRLHDDRPTLRELAKVRSPTLVLVIAGGTVAAFTAGGLMAWMPTIVVRYHGFSVWSGGLLLALLAGVGALGALFGGYVGDRAEAKREGGRARAMAIAFACVIPVGTIGLFAHDRATFISLTALTIFGMAFYAGPIIAVIDDVVPRRFAATGQAAFLLVSHLGGDAIAPAAVGGLADHVGGHDGLRYAALLPFGALGLAVLFFALASKLHARDHARARALDEKHPDASADQPALDLG